MTASNTEVDFLGFDVPSYHCHRPIKVLSLFDGISTGKCLHYACLLTAAVFCFFSILRKLSQLTVTLKPALFLLLGLVTLDKLGINVSEYFSSEIDKDAIAIQKKRFPLRVRRIGCVTEIDEKALDEMGPIDLVIGGSPCNDLSRVNPKRRGLFGKLNKNDKLSYPLFLPRFI